MWIARKTSEIREADDFASRVGVVSVGGGTPAVVTEGELRSVELIKTGGAVYLPRAGEEVLLERTGDNEQIVLGVLEKPLPSGVAAGEIYISNGSGALVHIKNDGSVHIRGNLMINGMPYVPAV